jgi:hypothetical protein
MEEQAIRAKDLFEPPIRLEVAVSSVPDDRAFPLCGLHPNLMRPSGLQVDFQLSETVFWEFFSHSKSQFCIGRAPFDDFGSNPLLPFTGVDEILPNSLFARGHTGYQGLITLFHLSLFE